MTKIDGTRNNVYQDSTKTKESGGFGKAMAKVADGALSTVSTVGSTIPGGGLVGAAAQGIRALLGGGGSEQDQMDKMWEMQKQSQMFNMQYLELQTAIQDDNRRFSTLSNLMKCRHDTAKAAINNMHV